MKEVKCILSSNPEIECKGFLFNTNPVDMAKGKAVIAMHSGVGISELQKDHTWLIKKMDRFKPWEELENGEFFLGLKITKDLRSKFNSKVV